MVFKYYLNTENFTVFIEVFKYCQLVFVTTLLFGKINTGYSNAFSDAQYTTTRRHPRNRHVQITVDATYINTTFLKVFLICLPRTGSI